MVCNVCMAIVCVGVVYLCLRTLLNHYRTGGDRRALQSSSSTNVSEQIGVGAAAGAGTVDSGGDSSAGGKKRRGRPPSKSVADESAAAATSGAKKLRTSDALAGALPSAGASGMAPFQKKSQQFFCFCFFYLFTLSRFSFFFLYFFCKRYCCGFVEAHCLFVNFPHVYLLF